MITSRLIFKDFGICRGSSFRIGLGSLSLSTGAIYGLIGPNGSGKSTFLEAVYGEIDYSGEMSWAGPAGSCERKNSLAYVRQDYPLLDIYSVEESVLLSHAFARKPGELRSLFDICPNFTNIGNHAKFRAEKFIDILGLSQFKTKMPDELSGGQKQRLAIALALTSIDKSVILLDEPTSALGAKETELLQDAIKYRQSETDSPMFLIASHDRPFLAGITQRLISFEFPSENEECAQPQTVIVNLLPTTKSLLSKET